MLADTITRRRSLVLLASVPVVGGIIARFEEAESDRRRRRKAHRRQDSKHAQAQGRRKKKKDKKPTRCKPDSISQTCAGRCGAQTNNCKAAIDCGLCTTSCVAQPITQTCARKCGTVLDNCNNSVDCGHCICNPTCQTCQICTSAGTCVTDPTMVGHSCGNCHVCSSAGQCISCPQCCDANGTCQDGTTNQACGATGQSCGICTGQEQCQNRQCVCIPLTSCPLPMNCDSIGNGCGTGTISCGGPCPAPHSCGGGRTPNVCGCIGTCGSPCSSRTDCPSDHLCVDGACQECDATCTEDRCPSAITIALGQLGS